VVVCLCAGVSVVSQESKWSCVCGSQESKWPCVCVLGVSILSLFIRFSDWIFELLWWFFSLVLLAAHSKFSI
jgi:hypothetical protein